MDRDLIIQRPAAAQALVLLFHGVGANAESLLPVGQQVAQWQPEAVVVSVRAPFPVGPSGGRQWFSVQGITTDNRPTRVAQVMPAFLDAIQAWQVETGLGPGQTLLIGFSQGAIMSLAASQQSPSPAGRVAALAGRFPQAPQHASPGTTIHLLHGQADAVVPVQSSIEAHQQLQALGGSSTLDLVPGLGHGIDAVMLGLLRARLGR